MFRKLSLLAVAALFLLLPARLIAGGPPWLCLPIDGVTPENARECADLLTTKLEKKLWPHAGQLHGIKILQHSGQWYLTFYMGEDVALGDVEAALKGSGFSVPRDRLRLFGHVILEIDARKTPSKELLAELKEMNHVSVAESEDKEDRLLVTVDMPYPADDGGPEGESVAWDKFKRNDFSSDQSTRSESPATSEKLPGYGAFRALVARHMASLKDIRWTAIYACRPLGGVAVREQDTVISAKRSSPKGR